MSDQLLKRALDNLVSEKDRKLVIRRNTFPMMDHWTFYATMLDTFLYDTLVADISMNNLCSNQPDNKDICSISRIAATIGDQIQYGIGDEWTDDVTGNVFYKEMFMKETQDDIDSILYGYYCFYIHDATPERVLNIMDDESEHKADKFAKCENEIVNAVNKKINMRYGHKMKKRNRQLI
jgi:hypothetical protein